MLDNLLVPPSFVWKKNKEARADKLHQWIQTQDENEMREWDCVFFGAPLSKSSISPSGASEFPEFFRRSWNKFATYSIDYELDLTELKVCDLGDVKMHGTDIPLCHRRIRQAAAAIHERHPDALIGGIGGDHSTTAMMVMGMQQANPDKKIGILQFDTHFDLRDIEENGPTNGTPMRQLIESGIIQGSHIHTIGLHGFHNAKELREYAKEKGVRYFPLSHTRKRGVEQTVRASLDDLAKEVDFIYVTIDMDVLDMAYAPGVPAATPGGMLPQELLSSVYLAGSHPKVGTFDIVCVDPLRDKRNHPTIQLGTTVFLTMLCGRHSQKNKNA